MVYTFSSFKFRYFGRGPKNVFLSCCSCALTYSSMGLKRHLILLNGLIKCHWYRHKYRIKDSSKNLKKAGLNPEGKTVPWIDCSRKKIKSVWGNSDRATQTKTWQKSDTRCSNNRKFQVHRSRFPVSIGQSEDYQIQQGDIYCKVGCSGQERYQASVSSLGEEKRPYTKSMCLHNRK